MSSPTEQLPYMKCFHLGQFCTKDSSRLKLAQHIMFAFMHSHQYITENNHKAM